MNRRRFLEGALAAAAGPALAQTPSSKPNVVVFLVDDMGYADIGPFDAKSDIRTPHIDRLAREGVKFTQFYSNGPVCTPTRAALMTGRYQQRVGLEWALTLTDAGKGLPAGETTLATMLRNNGYSTALIGKWHLGQEPKYSPNRHGFDYFFGIKSGNVDHYSHKLRAGLPDFWENETTIEKVGYITDLLADRAVSWIGEQGSRPFFLYFAFNTVHWPFQPPGKPDEVRTEKTWLHGSRKDYVRMIENMDQAVGRVLSEMDQRGLAKNTLVIFTNDNGGERYSDNRPFFHHKATLWEGGIRVPAIARWPGRVPSGKTTEQVAATMDLTATILSATGSAPPRDRKFDGIDLLPILAGKQAPVARTLFWRINRADRKQKAARQGDWKYIQDGIIEMLFNVKSDPSERTDVAPWNPEKLVELRNEYNAWENELARNPPPFVVN